MKYQAKRLSKLALMSLQATGIAAVATTALPMAAAIGMPVAANEIDGYKTWTRVNREPVLGDEAAMRMCAAPSTISKQRGPHKDKYITVYVNEIGKAALTGQRLPQFPPGSIIVKEKLATPEATAPELLTAMVKRETGYNPAGGDWDYLVLSGDAKTVQAQGKLETCMACHATRSDTGYVFRQYLRGEAWSKLK